MKTCPQCKTKNVNSATECEECGLTLKHVQTGITNISMENAVRPSKEKSTDTLKSPNETKNIDEGESNAPKITLTDDTVNGAVNLVSEKEVPSRPWGMLLILIFSVYTFIGFIKQGVADHGIIYLSLAGIVALIVLGLLVITIKGFIKPTMVIESGIDVPKLANKLYSKAYVLWEQKKEEELIKVFAKLIVECPDSQELEWAHNKFIVNQAELYDMVEKYRSDKHLS